MAIVGHVPSKKHFKKKRNTKTMAWTPLIDQLTDLRDEYKKKIEEKFERTGDIYWVVKMFETSFYISEPFIGVDVGVGVNDDINIAVVITTVEPDKKWNVKFTAITPIVTEAYEDTWELSA